MSCRNRRRQVDQKKLLESCSPTNMASIHAPIVASSARSHSDRDAPRIGRVKRRVPVPVFLLNLTAHPFPASYGEVSGARPNQRPACRLSQLHRQIAFRLSHPASAVCCSSLSIRYMAPVIWSLTSERRLLRSIACGPEKIFFYLAHLATQGYRSALPNTLIYGQNGVIPLLDHLLVPPIAAA